MAKSFHELGSRAQLAVFVVLSLLTVGGAWQVLLNPAMTEIAARRQRLVTVETELGKARAVANKLPALQREVRTLEAKLRETEAVIPDEKDPQDVLRNLHDLASDSLLDIASFKPKPIVARTEYTEWPIELGLEGGYHDLGRFFGYVATMARLMSVSDLEIKTRVRPNGRGTVTASCVATTFVFQKDSALGDVGDRP
jgi:type IV pilus assembly protein PilO